MSKQDNALTPPPKETSFEIAFARLEEILERMNTGTISLDESLRLYEEADRLITLCNKRLTEAEQRVEVLIKNRSGDLQTNVSGKPMTTDFPPTYRSGPEAASGEDTYE